MKKLIVAISALVYLTTSTGALLHMHYCMGELANWGLGYNTSKTCGKCGMKKSDEKNKDCCKDELKFIKNETDQKTINTSVQWSQLFALALPVSAGEIPHPGFTPVTEENPICHAPPRSSGVAVYIRNCFFLI